MISGSRDSAQKKLYSTRGTKKKSSTHPWHMTWEMVMKNALKELAPQLKLQWKQIDDHYKWLTSEAQQEVHNQKEQERLDKQQQATAEKQKERELELKKEQKKCEAAERWELAAAKRAEEAARKKAETESRRAATIARKAAAAAVASSKKAAVFPMSDHKIETNMTPVC
ncbi:hypothetical protein BDQ17DRAFT_1361555 [Cyathus striatus]|nr:hypothetical protein BDQ17DRAFT_1361555 [Cyathus striatus]